MSDKGDDLVKYLEHIFHLFEGNEFSEVDEQKHILKNVRAEIKGQEQYLAKSPEGSKIFESLFKFYDPQHLIDLLNSLSQPAVDLSFNVFGSRVLEKLFGVLKEKILDRSSTEESAIENAEKLVKSLKELKILMQGDANQEGGGEKEVSNGWGWIELISDGKASHVIRSLFQLLINQEDLLIKEQDNKKSIKKKKNKKCLNVITIQKQLWEIFLSIVEDILDPSRSVKRKKQLENGSYNQYVSPALQIIIKSLYTIKNYNFIQVVHKDQMNELQARANELLNVIVTITLSKINLSLIKHKIGSHFIENTIHVLSDDAFYDLFTKQFRGNLLTLSQHNSANFVVQKMILSVRNEPQAGLVLSELIDHFNDLIYSRTGIITSLLEIGNKFQTNIKQIYTNLLQCILGKNFKQPNLFTKTLSKKLCSKPNSSFYHFSCLLIQLLKFPSQYSQIIASS